MYKCSTLALHTEEEGEGEEEGEEGSPQAQKTTDGIVTTTRGRWLLMQLLR